MDTCPLSREGVSTPQRHRQPYPPEFRERIVELVRAGRSPEDLSAEFEPSAQTIRNWVAQADRDAGRRSDGLTSAERDELRKLRRENKRLRVERDILPESRGLVRARDRRRASEVFGFMTANQAQFPVQVMCEVLGVSRAGFYA